MEALKKIVKVLIDAELVGAADFEKAGLTADDMAFLDGVGDGDVIDRPIVPKILYGDGWAQFLMGSRVYRVHANRTIELRLYGDPDTVHLTVPYGIRTAGWARILVYSARALHQIGVIDDTGYNEAMTHYFFRALAGAVLQRVAAQNGFTLDVDTGEGA